MCFAKILKRNYYLFLVPTKVNCTNKNKSLKTYIGLHGPYWKPASRLVHATSLFLYIKDPEHCISSMLQCCVFLDWNKWHGMGCVGPYRDTDSLFDTLFFLTVGGIAPLHKSLGATICCYEYIRYQARASARDPHMWNNLQREFLTGFMWKQLNKAQKLLWVRKQCYLTHIKGIVGFKDTKETEFHIWIFL